MPEWRNLPAGRQVGRRASRVNEKPTAWLFIRFLQSKKSPMWSEAEQAIGIVEFSTSS